MCFLPTTFPNAPAHHPPPPILFDQSLRGPNLSAFRIFFIVYLFAVEKVHYTWEESISRGNEESAIKSTTLYNVSGHSIAHVTS